ncbi:MAG: Nif3-like dinuclear metal center hexameric protein [Desulfovibrio sp.]|jgi:dinuclear metal center YbgI/SA1388 family protein|nr:Nif3-like dinuclear metal center hexameric protein [Desulfovibrio sp.]
MQLIEITSILEKIAPLSSAAPWDNSGIQVACRRTSATSLAVCLDPTPTSVRRSLDIDAQYIVSHHPLLLKPALPNRLDAYHEVLRLLFNADVPLYAAHTSLDANPEGPAAWLARELNLVNLSVLEPTSPAPAAGGLPTGFGFAGDLPCARTLEAIISTLARHINLSSAVLCGVTPETVTRVAYCTGSGSSLLAAAQRAGAQLFITGDVKYHTALTAEICLLDVGHHSLEEEMMRRLSLVLQQQLPLLTVSFVPSESPMRPLVLA